MPLTTATTNDGGLSSGSTAPAHPPAPAHRGSSNGEAGRIRSRHEAWRHETTERVAAAAAEMAAQVAQSKDAAESLMKTIEELAAGAEQAAAASQQSAAVVTTMSEHVASQRDATARVLEMADALRQLVGVSRDEIGELLANVKAAAERQRNSVTRISDLERKADEIGSILDTVARIADETNLLALNAAIEAARAKEHGRGFAVVADEVRALAETSERSATEIRDLIAAVRQGVTSVAAGVKAASEAAETELAKGESIATDLAGIRGEIDEIASASAEIATAANQASAATAEVRGMAEEIASAAEEQATAIGESLQTIEQQFAALQEIERATEEIAATADSIRTTDDTAGESDALAAAAEEVGAAVGQISRSTAEIAIALKQIAAGAELQSTSVHRSEAAIAQLGAGAVVAEERAAETAQRVGELLTLLTTNQVNVSAIIDSIETTSVATVENVRRVTELEEVSRGIDRIVDAIANVALQTNMLAVSGSVESARAGEFGRGFAVVSGDIRNLAKDSAANAERIKSLMRDVQDQISATRADVGDTARMAETEAQRARQTGVRLAEIERDMTSIDEASTIVRLGSEHVSTGLVQIREGVEGIAAAARQADALTARAAIAAAQQSTGAEQLAEAIEEIESLATELRDS